MTMQFDSINAKHKLFIVSLLLGLFILPVALHWQSFSHADLRATMDGGAVIGNSAAAATTQPVSVTNNVGQGSVAAGASFTGALAQR